MREELLNVIKTISAKTSIRASVLASFVEVETGGEGFSKKTGKIIIQFEPKWFKRKVPYAPSGKWSLNKVEVQDKEWEAFNNAFSIDKNGAMESTSIGLGQIMGFHYKRLGFRTVGEMWDFSKVSLENQLELIVRFILTDKKLYKAIIDRDWHTVASIYNGEHYMKLARDIGREPYNISLEKAYQKYSKIL